MIFEHDDSRPTGVCIKAIGVGGGGSNAVGRMIKENIPGVEFVAINTDLQALDRSEATTKLAIGEKITRGFGAGANPQIGARAADESIEAIKALLKGTDMVFVTAGMGGGTGTGAAPIVARAAHDMDILTVGIVTKPFNFEGKRRMQQAEEGIRELSQYVDSLVVIPNEMLHLTSSTKITICNAFDIADDALRRGVQSISDLIVNPGFINVDFADVTSVMKNAGYAHMGVGYGTGKDKAEEAAKQAITSPLMESTITGARGVLMNITVNPNTSLDEVEIASEVVAKEANPDANIIWGITYDDDLDDQIKITIIATGFDKPVDDASMKVEPAPPKQEENRMPPRTSRPPESMRKQPEIEPTVRPVKPAKPRDVLDNDEINTWGRR
ncbi:MAG: cell division protein FtsZ [Clostridia bacterium]|nr:cell division protein FtsZ [Clostridia bacterium]